MVSCHERAREGPHAWHSSDVANGFAARRADVGRMLVEGRRELLLDIEQDAHVREEGTSTDHHRTPARTAPRRASGRSGVCAHPDESGNAGQSHEAVRTLMRVRTGAAWIVARSSVRHGSKRCHLLCVAGIAKRVAKTSCTVIASNCGERCQASARELTRESCRASATWCAPNALSSIASRRESVVSLACLDDGDLVPRHERRV